MTRGSLFHQIQAEFFRALEKNGLLPVSERRVDAARKMLDWAIGAVSKKAYDDLAPAIDRVWHDELASIARDLRGWLEGLARDGGHWRPERFEFSFGLPGDLNRDPRSVPEPAHVDGRFLIRGSIDLIERRLDGTALRVTDHKTGKNRTSLATMVDGGRVLQPILYGMALEAVTGEHVEEGRLSYCTSVGGLQRSLDHAGRRKPSPRARSARSDRSGHRARHPGGAPRGRRVLTVRFRLRLRRRRGTAHAPQAGGPLCGSRRVAPDSSPTSAAPPADDRDLIRTALDDTLIVEAAAGTGQDDAAGRAHRPC